MSGPSIIDHRIRVRTLRRSHYSRVAQTAFAGLNLKVIKTKIFVTSLALSLGIVGSADAQPMNSTGVISSNETASPLRPMLGTWEMNFIKEDGNPAVIKMGIVRVAGNTAEGFYEAAWGSDAIYRAAIYGTLDREADRFIFNSIETQTNLRGGGVAVKANFSEDMRWLKLGIDESATWKRSDIPRVPKHLELVVNPPHDRARLYQQVSGDYITYNRVKIQHGPCRELVSRLVTSSDTHVCELATLIMEKFDLGTRLQERLVNGSKSAEDAAGPAVSMLMVRTLNDVWEDNGPIATLVDFMNSEAVQSRLGADEAMFVLLTHGLVTSIAISTEIRREAKSRISNRLEARLGKSYSVNDDGFAVVTLVNRGKTAITDCSLIIDTEVNEDRVREFGREYFKSVEGTQFICSLIGVNLNRAIVSDNASLAYLALDKSACFYIPSMNPGVPHSFSLGIPLDNLQRFGDRARIWVGAEQGIVEEDLDLAALKKLVGPPRSSAK